MGKWSRLRITLLFLAALSAHASDRKEIIAGPVRLADGGMSGSFRIEASALGVQSVGTGGACLVFSMRRRGGAACRTDGDCKLDELFSGGSGYCLSLRKWR